MVQSWDHFYLLDEQVHCPSVRKLCQNFASFHCGRDSLSQSAQERIQLTNQPQTNNRTRLSVLSTVEGTYRTQIFKDTILLFVNQHSSYCPCHHCYQDNYPKSNSSRRQEEVFWLCVCVPQLFLLVLVINLWFPKQTHRTLACLSSFGLKQSIRVQTVRWHSPDIKKGRRLWAVFRKEPQLAFLADMTSKDSDQNRVMYGGCWRCGQPPNSAFSLSYILHTVTPPHQGKNYICFVCWLVGQLTG